MTNRLSLTLYTALVLLVGLALAFAAHAGQRAPGGAVRFEISLPPQAGPAPVDGRLLLMVSNDARAEPRFQINDSPSTQVIAGVDVNGMAPGTPAVIDGSAVTY